MKKKLLFLLPVLVLATTSCGSGAGGNLIPQGGTELKLWKASEEDKGEIQAADFVAGLKSAIDGLKNPEAYQLSSSFNVSAALSASAQLVDWGTNPEDSNKHYAPASVSIEDNYGGKLEAGFAGFGQQTKVKDLYAYVKASDVHASLKGNYDIPATYYEQIEANMPGFMKAKNNFDFTLNNTAVNAYLNNGVVYADATDPNIEKFYTSVRSNGVFVIDAIPGAKENVPDWNGLLAMLGLTALKVKTTLPGETAVPVNFDVTSYLPEGYEGMLALVPSMIEQYKEVFEAFNFKAYKYADNSDYALAFTAGLNKASLAIAFDKFIKPMVNTTKDFEGFIADYGVTLNKFSVELGVTLYRKGGIEFKGKAEVEASLNYETLVRAVAGQNAEQVLAFVKEGTVTLKSSGDASFKLALGNAADVRAAVPTTYDDSYKELPLVRA